MSKPMYSQRPRKQPDEPFFCAPQRCGSQVVNNWTRTSLKYSTIALCFGTTVYFWNKPQHFGYTGAFGGLKVYAGNENVKEEGQQPWEGVIENPKGSVSVLLCSSLLEGPKIKAFSPQEARYLPFHVIHTFSLQVKTLGWQQFNIPLGGGSSALTFTIIKWLAHLKYTSGIIIPLLCMMFWGI